MSSENLPNPEEYDPNLEAQDEELNSGGNNRLLYILVAVVMVLVLGYVIMPKGQGSGIASATPSFMLDDAAVTATAPTAADSIAAGLKAAPAAAKTTDEVAPGAAAKAAVAVRPLATAPVAAPAVAAAPVVAPVAPAAAPEPVAAVPVAAPAAAPANVMMTGKIEDENGRPLVGATVLLKGSSKGTSTDANGNYTLEVPGGNDNTLVYGYGGYDDEVLRANGSKPMNVTLTPRAKASRKRR